MKRLPVPLLQARGTYSTLYGTTSRFPRKRSQFDFFLYISFTHANREAFDA